MRFSSSYLISLALHIALVLLLLAGSVLLPPVRLDIPNNQVTIINLDGFQGGIEGAVIPKDFAGYQKDTPKDTAPEESNPKAETKPKEETKPQEQPEDNSPKIIKDPVKPEEKPKEEKPKVEKPKDKPKEDKPKEDKPKDKPKEDPKPQDNKGKDDTKEKNDKQDKPKGEKSKPNPALSDEDILNKALSSAASDVKTRDKSGGGQGKGEGQGFGDGVGIEASYLEIIKTIVRRNWSYSGRADRTQLKATVHITIDVDGKIISYRIVSNSGDPTFDATLMNAIGRSADMIPEPPNGTIQELDIVFYDSEM